MFTDYEIKAIKIYGHALKSRQFLAIASDEFGEHIQDEDRRLFSDIECTFNKMVDISNGLWEKISTTSFAFALNGDIPAAGYLVPVSDGTLKAIISIKTGDPFFSGCVITDINLLPDDVLGFKHDYVCCESYSTAELMTEIEDTLNCYRDKILFYLEELQQPKSVEVPGAKTYSFE